jgi:hypothetical protein
MPQSISRGHISELQNAKFLLEKPSIAARFASSLAAPVEGGMKRLPKSASDTILNVATRSLESALDAALLTLGDTQQPAWLLTHKASVAISGAAGGAFGLPALAIELPISTTIILRSIADIARSEGEKLSSREPQLACLEVFALGGTASDDDAAETGYFGIRAALAGAVSEATKHFATHGAATKGSPALVRLISQIAARFSIPVTEKAAAQAVPLIGAAGGALINTLFIDHFQNIARGHFVVRRLERLYGADLVRSTYASLPSSDDEGQE